MFHKHNSWDLVGSFFHTRGFSKHQHFSTLTQRIFLNQEQFQLPTPPSCGCHCILGVKGSVIPVQEPSVCWDSSVLEICLFCILMYSFNLLLWAQVCFYYTFYYYQILFPLFVAQVVPTLRTGFSVWCWVHLSVLISVGGFGGLFFSQFISLLAYTILNPHSISQSSFE